MSHRAWLWVVLLLSLAVRLYAVTAPLTDGGLERQTQTAIIARNLYVDGLNLFYPRMNIFAPQPGYVALEFPLQAELMALSYVVFGGVHDIAGRLITIAFSMASIVLMYLLAKFFVPPRAALIATTIYALTPMSIYFGRAVYPEPLLLTFSFAALYLLLRWTDTPKVHLYLGSAICAALAGLVKAPPGMVMVFPLLAIWWVRYGRGTFARVDFYAYFALALGPIGGWVAWSAVMADPDPAAGFNVYQLATINRAGIPWAWFNPRFYGWMARALVVVALTPLGILLAAMGLPAVRGHRLALVVYAWIGGMLLFVFATPAAQMTHWNYQVPLIPVGALLAGFAVDRLPMTWLRRHRLAALAGAAVMLAGTIAIYAVVLRDAYDINRRAPYAREVGAIVQREIPNEGFVLLLQPGAIHTTQSYFMNRDVRALSVYNDPAGVTPAGLDQWRARGAIALVAVDTPYDSGTAVVRGDPALLAYLRRTFRTVVEGDHYMIYSTR